MESRPFRHTSIFSTQVEKLHDPNLKSFPEFCLYDHPAIEAICKSSEPIFKVCLTRLEPSVRVYSDARMTNTVACSEQVSEVILTEIPIYDTKHLGQLMCVGVGRFPHNLLRPFVGDSMHSYYEHPELFDPSALCAQVSRDHGLIFLNTDGRLLFRDFGTKKKGRRSGSKNGTWINGEEPIQDLVINWSHEDFLGVGGRILVETADGPRKEHYFKLRYERCKNESWISPASDD